jgi:hypothetical protein
MKRASSSWIFNSSRRPRNSAAPYRAGNPQRIVVIAGLDPAIHSVTPQDNRHRNGMDARVKSGHDDWFDVIWIR